MCPFNLKTKGNKTMKNLIIGLGNTGTNIIKECAKSANLNDVTLYCIDSVNTSFDLDMINRVNIISIVSDEKTGSGRSRERGNAMFKFHEENGDFNKLYEDAVNAKSPVIVITSGAGGTGSGSCTPLCEALLLREVQVIPIIINPNKNDPAAFHLNANDLLIELDEVGITTYSIFENRRNDADYRPINQEVVNLIEIMFGKKYDVPVHDNSNGDITHDTIDDSDLDNILSWPGRIIGITAEASSIPALQKEITRKLFVGFQPMWKPDDVKENTLMKGYSLTSMFADEDFKHVFSEIDNRLSSDVIYDEYRNIAKLDNDGMATASLIITGLPRPEVKQIDTEYKSAGSIGDGIKRSGRPSFMTHKKATITTKTLDPNNESTGSAIKQFGWK